MNYKRKKPRTKSTSQGQSPAVRRLTGISCFIRVRGGGAIGGTANAC